MTPKLRVAPNRISRQVARDRVRSSLVSAADELFGAGGFEASTTAEIAERAGVSQRTFFRYFSCKEDVVLDWNDSYNARICERLRTRPADEAPLESLRRALDVYCHLPEEEAARIVFVKELTASSWGLRARLLAKMAVWEGHIATELERRGIASGPATFLANFAVGILNVAFRGAGEQDAVTVEERIDAGFEVLKGAIGQRF